VTGPPARAWPHGLLDIGALRADGWRPTPFRDFVLKVHQRCNLACDYCYVYTMSDQSWLHRPRMMTPPIWRAAAERIGEHVRTHRLSGVRVILHGGEPILAGASRLARLAADVRAAVPADCAVEICVQTNGVLLDEPVLRVLRASSISVGISLDGTSAHNARRRRPDGQGSFAAVDRALRLLNTPEYRDLFAGLLCTVDVTADPVECYDALVRYDPPATDFLLPHANWSSAPRRAGTPTAYGDWLVAVFDRWYGAPSQETRIRLFEDVISLLLGGSSRSEQVGLSPVGVLVIETDGAIEQVDSLKSTYPGACATGLTVFDDPLDRALTHPGVVARQIGTAALSPECVRCPIHRVCGSGHYAHRYRAGSGFRNPSVYCADLRRLIDHVHRRVVVDLTRRLARTHP
jgi:uncharacterized protein